MMSALPPPREMLARLVAIPSVSSPEPSLDQSNLAVVELLAEWAEGLGLSVEVMPLPSQPAKANLVAKLGSGDDGLVLSGHTDTVPYDERGWSSDPFTLTERNGRLYGLGTADMKAFFAAALHAIAAIDGAQLRKPLTLVATADEESTMAGARALAKAGRALGRVAIIGEPTGLVPIRKHKGVWMAKIVIGGRAGHASQPAHGVNAIEGLGLVIDALKQWQVDLARKHRDNEFEVPAPTINLGRVMGGDSPNRICARCELDVDMRLLPSMNHADVEAELRAVVQDALAPGDWTAEVRPTGVHVDAYSLEPTNAFCQAIESISGRGAQAVMFGTEAPFFAQVGLETIVLGAGGIEVAHAPDEYVGVAALEEATKLYKAIIDRFCVEAT